MATSGIVIRRIPTSSACSRVARSIRAVTSSGLWSLASVSGVGLASRATNSAVREAVIVSPLADLATHRIVGIIETITVSSSHTNGIAVERMAKMTVGLWARWAAMHGIPRAVMKIRSRLGDPLARLLAGHGRGIDPYPLYDEVRARGPLVKTRFAGSPPITRSAVTFCATNGSVCSAR